MISNSSKNWSTVIPHSEFHGELDINSNDVCAYIPCVYISKAHGFFKFPPQRTMMALHKNERAIKFGSK